MSSTTQNQIVEHVVLFKLNDDGANSGKINSIINELVTLDQVLHLFSGPIHRLRSTSTTVSAFIAVNPDHVRIVKEAESNREDVMAVDWIPDHPSTASWFNCQN